MPNFQCHISWNGDWVDLNDGLLYRVDGSSMQTSPKTWRKIQATSPILEGNYLVHAVPEMQSETVKIHILGDTVIEVQLRMRSLEEYFTQFQYELRWRWGDHQEFWTCQLADSSWERGQIMFHNIMGMITFTVPRFSTAVVVDL